MEGTLFPYGHRASGRGAVSDAVRQAMSPKDENKGSAETAIQEEKPSYIEESISDTQRLLPKKKKRRNYNYYGDSTQNLIAPSLSKEWLRPYWLGFSLCLTLFAFWLLDSLKDPVFGALVNGNLKQHQPPAKLCSVGGTLLLVCLLELWSFSRKRSKRTTQEVTRQDVLDGGGTWTRMSISDQPGLTYSSSEPTTVDDGVDISIFAYVGGAYAMAFVLMAHLIRFHTPDSTSRAWHVLAYILYATIESFGSISVATFWSFTNSTLCLQDAERFYGPIIAMAQLGAIGGSSMVTTHFWSPFILILVACLVIVLQILIVFGYSKRFRPTSEMQDTTEGQEESQESGSIDLSVLWSGVKLILRHNYVLLILGVSCLYEISLTCLDYQLKLLGWSRFEEQTTSSMTFTRFMGHYGQLTNATSLLLSYICFPYLIRSLGLRYTLRLFPTLLVVVTVLAFFAIPANLAVLFFSMALLKAMTYSIHDPSKELLYLPTSNAIKFRAKFWIDVVGARIAKAMGSSINNYAGSVDRIVRFGSVPSLLTAVALWLVCYRAGIRFDELNEDGAVVGQSGESTERKVISPEVVVVFEDEERPEDEKLVPPRDKS